MKNYEETLPEGYREVYHINAKDFKVGLIMNAVAFVPVIAVMAIAIAIAVALGIPFNENAVVMLIEMVVALFVMVIYIIAHELLHGIAYKSLTHRKLTFGLSWSCAFCGVPDIYCYRRTAMIALILPFAVFSVVFTVVTVFMYFVDFLAVILGSFVLGMHLGGCSGDLWMFGLFIFKFRDKTLLMRDTGPEQFIYLKNE